MMNSTEFDSETDNLKSERRYDDFSTLDWMYHRSRGHSRGHSHPTASPENPRITTSTSSGNLRVSVSHNTSLSQPKRCVPWKNYCDGIKNLHYDLQTWLAVTIIGILLGFIATWLDVIIEWAGDLKEGMCHSFPYLGKKKCCWEQWDECTHHQSLFNRILLSLEPDDATVQTYYKAFQ
jgi:chloride channel 3/4/5